MSMDAFQTNPIERLWIHGVSGHGRVVADVAERVWPQAELLGCDDASAKHGGVWMHNRVCQAPPEHAPAHASGAAIHLAVGDNAIRERLAQRYKLLELSTEWLTLVHPAASVSAHARLGRGCLVAAQAVLGPGARVGHGTIVNHSAIVDHDVVLGDFVHAAPGSVLGGGASLGQRVFLGARAVVLPGVSICDDVLISAGAVVTRDITEPGVWLGVPARKREP
jgi:sugar O-acyltransferase (sialic acid O-acetyltransferase NeuD family)